MPDAGIKPCGGAAARPVLDASAIQEVTVATEPVSPGRARHTPQNHRAGKAGLHPVHLWSAPRALFAHGITGANRHLAFPAPLRLSEGEKTNKTRAYRAART